MIKIIAYTTKTCSHCTEAKKFLNAKGYAYEERDVNLDPKANREFQTLKLQGVPSFLIGNQTVVGFDPEKIEAFLDYFISPCPSCGKKFKFPKNKGKLKIKCNACEHQFEIDSTKK